MYIIYKRALWGENLFFGEEKGDAKLLIPFFWRERGEESFSKIFLLLCDLAFFCSFFDVFGLSANRE
jgi:hypothetical protein